MTTIRLNVGEWREKAKDLRESLGLVVSGASYLWHDHRASDRERQVRPLSDVNDVELQRPLVICPGWNTDLDAFEYLTDKLVASGSNGAETVYLKEGRAFRDWKCDRPLPAIPQDSKVFVSLWDDRRSPPDKTGPQLKDNLDLLQSALGSGKVDVLGYSMGGLAARVYLDQGGQAVDHLLTLGTSHQGTRLAQMSERVLSRDIQWAMNFAGLVAADLPAMRWLSAGGEAIEDLNSRWPQQRSQVAEVRWVGARTEPTPAVSGWPWRLGDGMVEPARSRPPGESAALVQGPAGGFLHHGSLPHDSQVFGQLREFFGFEDLGHCSSDPRPESEIPYRLTPFGQV